MDDYDKVKMAITMSAPLSEKILHSLGVFCFLLNLSDLVGFSYGLLSKSVES